MSFCISVWRWWVVQSHQVSCWQDKYIYITFIGTIRCFTPMRHFCTLDKFLVIYWYVRLGQITIFWDNYSHYRHSFDISRCDENTHLPFFSISSRSLLKRNVWFFVSHKLWECTWHDAIDTLSALLGLRVHNGAFLSSWCSLLFMNKFTIWHQDTAVVINGIEI